MSFLTYGTRDSEGNYCTCNAACITECGCGCKFCAKPISIVIEGKVINGEETLPGEIWIDCSKSSNLTNIKYNAETKELKVKFKSDKHGGIYKDVSEEDVNGLMTAESKGSYLHSVIKPKYKYQRILSVNG